MRKLIYFLLLGVLSLPLQQSFAQDKPQEKPKSDENEKLAIPIRVQIVVSEFDGEKKISSMPYSFISITNERFGGYYSTSLRNGIRIPVEIDSKDQKTTYFDIGSNIDCGIRTVDDGRFHLYLIFEQSSLYPSPGSDDAKVQVSRPEGQPLIRQFKSSVNVILKDGETSESVVSTDPLNGHTRKISATIHVVK
jgi:hypothetical protein